jgi:tetratricopeptide (TPR) repeat protein
MIASLVLLTASIATTGASKAAASPTQSAPAASSAAAAPQPEVALRKIAEGDRKWREKNYRDASRAYEEAVNAEPTNVEALFKLGTTYEVLGFHRQAIDRWNRVLQLTTDAAVKKSAEENIAKAQAKVSKAGAGNSQAAGTQPARSPAFAAYDEGVKQINAGNYAGALENLTQAIRAEPKLALAYVARGSAYVGLRRYEEAAADYRQAQKIDPTLSAPLYGLAEALRGLGRRTDAREYYEKYAQSKATYARPDLQKRAREQAAALR